jgi:hypothetical protein
MDWLSPAETFSKTVIIGESIRNPAVSWRRTHLQVVGRVGCVLATQQWRGERATHEMTHLSPSTCRSPKGAERKVLIEESGQNPPTRQNIIVPPRVPER